VSGEATEPDGKRGRLTLLGLVVARQNLRQAIEGQGRREVAGRTGHVLGRTQGVHDGFLGTLHHGFVESVADFVEQNRDG